MDSDAREPTAMLEIDGGLRLRVGVDLLVELSVLRLRIAAAFAAKVRRPSEYRPSVKLGLRSRPLHLAAGSRHMTTLFVC